MIKNIVSTLVILATQTAFSADPHSYSQPHRIQVKHIDLDLNVDVEKKTLDGTATLTFDRKDQTADLILDTSGLKIESAQIETSKNKWADAKYIMGTIDPILGSKMEIELPKDKNVTKIRIKYAASPDATALQWNTPEQTSSGRPFLVTNNQPINARTWIPTQDTPEVRATYSAKITVAQKDLMAVMSAGNNPTKTNADGKYSFNMELPVPSYLIALSVGKLEFQSTGPRTGVYAEPEVITKAAKEFEDTEQMIQATEKLYGKYVWGRYDLLVLPASYPWGGMENPRLTFITPTLITGKKDLVDVVAHEIAHSWSGNLVTNAEWNDLWINEGFTTYVQYRIIEQLHGIDTRMRDMALDKTSLEETLADKSMKKDDTRLRADFAGRSPDEAFTDIPYIKGAFMLYSIEQKIGKPKFDAFLKSYFEKYSFKSISTKQAIEELSKIVDPSFLTQWINQPGLPADAAPIKSTIIENVDKMVSTFKLMGGAPGEENRARLTSKDTCYYLQKLPKRASIFKLDNLDQTFGFSNTVDPEVRTTWYKLTLPRGHKRSMETVEAFLSSVGRGKFVVPVYSALAETKKGKALAQSIYEKNKTFYAPNVRTRVEKKIYGK
jgi:leukotriene-A4 hydrolase